MVIINLEDIAHSINNGGAFMEKRKIIKSEAQKLLEGKWAKCMIAFAILIIIDYTISLIAQISKMFLWNCDRWLNKYVADLDVMMLDIVAITFTILISAAYILGEKKRYFNMASGQNPNSTESMTFMSVKGVWHTVKTYLAIGLRVIAWSILLFIPFLILGFGLFALTDLPDFFITEDVLYCIYIVLVVLYFLTILVAVQRYFLVPYIASNQPELKLNQVCKMSAKAMKKNKWRVLLFKLSYVLWIIPSILILPLFYTVPYYGAASALYAARILNK